MRNTIFIASLLILPTPVKSDVSATLFKLYQKANGDNPRTLYCNCQVIDKNTVNTKSCGIGTPTKALHIVDNAVWTSIISPKEIAMALPDNSCWGTSPCYDAVKDSYYIGHQCCLDTNNLYNKIFQDLNMLAPIPKSIADVRDFRIAGEPDSNYTFGTCSIRADKEFYSPTLRSLGIEARTRLLLSEVYGLNFSRSVLEKAKRDHLAYPATITEKKLSRYIRDYQGVGNRFTLNDWQEKNHNNEINRSISDMLDDIGELIPIRPD